MVAGHSLAGQRGCAGYPQEMQEHTALGRFEVIRLDLAGHIHGDEALQSQHHLRQIAVNVVDDLQPQAFFSAAAPCRTSTSWGTPGLGPSPSWAYRCTKNTGSVERDSTAAFIKSSSLSIICRKPGNCGWWAAGRAPQGPSARQNGRSVCTHSDRTHPAWSGSGETLSSRGAWLPSSQSCTRRQ